MGDDYDDYDYGDGDGGDVKFMDEIGAWDRGGGGSILGELLSNPNILIKGASDKKREIITPEDRFLIYSNALCWSMKDHGIYPFTQNDVNTLLQSTQGLEGLKYKNYVGYTLGYLATSNGTVMDKKGVKEAFRILERIKEDMTEGSDAGVEKEDVVRYARFWTRELRKRKEQEKNEEDPRLRRRRRNSEEEQGVEDLE